MTKWYLIFLKKQKVDWKSYLKKGKDDALFSAFPEKWTGAIPATHIIDGKGNSIALIEGMTSYDEVHKYLREAIGEWRQNR